MSRDYLVFPEKYFALISISVCQPSSSPPTFPFENDPCFDEPAIEQQQTCQNTDNTMFGRGPGRCLCLIRSLCFPTELQHKNKDISSQL